METAEIKHTAKPLTNDGQNYDDKIKNVPTTMEINRPKSSNS